jgi:hypothetical protein
VNSRIGDLDINWLQPVAEEAAKLAKVGPVDEARDEHGEWTSGGGGEGKVNTTPVKFTDGSGHDVVVAPEDFESRYPKISAEQEVSGLKVRNHVPNTDSIDATFNDPVVLSGIREVPFSDFTGPDKPTERTRALADSINESGEINPLIVGIDEKGPWIVEGGHRYDSLQFLGKKTFPAKVVLDGELFKARKLAKADDDEDIDWGYAADIADGLDLSGLSVMVDPVSQQGAQVSGSTATIALGQFGMDDNDVVNRVNERAAAWAALRAAEMVGMRYDAQGNLVPSRDASKRIDTATRNMLRQTIGDGLAAGQTVDEIGRDIYDGYGFSEERAALIANTEVRRASNQGALEGYAAIKSSGVPLKKEWLVADSPCEECEGNADDGAIGIDETFSSGDDAPPGHPNCVVGSSLIFSPGAIEGVTKRWYSGELVVIKTASGKELSVTPNHPIFSRRGFVAAASLHVGDDVGCRVLGVEGKSFGGDENEQDVVSTAEDKANSFLNSVGVSATAVPTAGTDFHGDCADGDVAIIGANRLLLDERNTEAGKLRTHFGLVSTYIWQLCLVHLGMSHFFKEAHLPPTHRVMGSLGKVLPLFGGERLPVGAQVGSGSESVRCRNLMGSLLRRSLFPSLLARFRVGGSGSRVVGSLFAGSYPNASALQSLSQVSRSSVEITGKPVKAETFVVEFDRVVEIELRGGFSGHVYNFQSALGWYFAQGVILHNCQCTLIPVTDDEGDDTEEAARPFDLAKWLSINYHKLRKVGPVDEPRDDHGRWTSGGGGGGEYRNVHSTRDLLSHFSDKDASVDDVIDSVKGTKEIDGKQLTAREAVEYNRERIAAGTSTDDLASGFKNADGTWTDQREALHQDIINRMFSEQAIEGAQPAAGEAPTMNMLGGRGGSGKGWITESGPLAGDRSIVIDADKIKEALGYHGWDAALYHEESSEIADKALGMARSMKLNVTYDATMRTGISSIQRASSFAEAGYNVRGYYMFSPPEQAARQALTRYMSGGRFVDPKYTFDSRSNEQSFDSVIPHLSSYQVYDGRSRTPKLVASGGK